MPERQDGIDEMLRSAGTRSAGAGGASGATTT
jgi:hypothetical protein